MTVAEITARGYSFPAGLVLSLMAQESGGQIGIVARVGAGDGSNASGLLQVIKATLDTYNASRPDIPWSRMSEKTIAAARDQIAVGTWYLNRCWSNLDNWLVDHGESASLADFARIADTAYAMGWGATKKKLNTMYDEAIPVSWDNLVLRFPNWGYSSSKERWINRPLKHAGEVWERYVAADASPGDPAEDEDDDITPAVPVDHGDRNALDVGLVVLTVAVVGLAVYIVVRF